jgi:hypothetical protein
MGAANALDCVARYKLDVPERMYVECACGAGRR